MESRKMVLMNRLQGSDGDVDGENGLVDTGKEGEGGKNCENSAETHALKHFSCVKLDSWWEFAV